MTSSQTTTNGPALVREMPGRPASTTGGHR